MAEIVMKSLLKWQLFLLAGLFLGQDFLLLFARVVILWHIFYVRVEY